MSEYRAAADQAKRFIEFLKNSGVFMLPAVEAKAIETLECCLKEAYHTGARDGLDEAAAMMRGKSHEPR